MLSFSDFKLLEAADSPAVTALETQIKDKLNGISDLKKTAKEGKKGVEAKVASLTAQSKAYSEISNLMTRLAGELGRGDTSKEGTTNIY